MPIPQKILAPQPPVTRRLAKKTPKFAAFQHLARPEDTLAAMRDTARMLKAEGEI